MRKRFGKLLWTFMLAALPVLYPETIQSQSSHSSSGDSTERVFREAMAAQDRGELDRAEALLSGLHDKHPNIFAINESFGLLLASHGNALRALPLLKAAVREQPASDGAHANLGAALYSLHRNSEAVAEFQRAVQLDPSNESAQQSLGRVLMDEQRPADAARALSAALRLSPGEVDLQLDCVTALLAANRTADATRILLGFKDADRSARAQALMGEAAEQRKDFSSAARHLTRAVELEPSEENAWLLSLELVRHWTFDAAIIELKAASAKYPDSKRIRIGLGAAFFGAAKYPEAISSFADLLETEPDNAMYAELLGVSCSAVMPEPRPRCTVLVHYAETHPADKHASTSAAAYLLSESDSESQRPLIQRLLDAALAADPGFPEAQFQMGSFLQDEGLWKESIPYLECAIKLKPNYSQAHYHLALAYWRAGRKQEGQAHMELQKKYSRQEQEDLHQRLDEITTFLVRTPN